MKTFVLNLFALLSLTSLYAGTFETRQALITLTSFEARINNQDVQLNWSTSQEKQFSHFILEQSTDGISFKEIALVFGIGESDSRIDYTFKDRNLTGLNSQVFYRLVSVDMDQQLIQSTTLIVRPDDSERQLSLVTYPNPVKQSLQVTVPVTWHNKKAVIEVLNLSGQLIYRMEKANISLTESIEPGSSVAGIYIVRVSCEGIVLQQKIVRQ